MSYATYTTLLPLFPKLPQSAAAAGYANVIAMIQSHIVRADALCDAYIAKQYSIPFVNVPPIIRAISEDITAYYTFRSYFTQDNSNRIEYYGELKDDAMATLGKIGNGDVSLVDTSGSLITFSTDFEIDSTTKDNATFFDIDEPIDWKFNSDLVDTVKDER